MNHQEIASEYIRYILLKIIKPLTVILLILLANSAMVSTAVYAQTPAISAVPSANNLKPDETVTITLSVDTPVDAFFFSLETVFDPEVFEFTGESTAGLTSGGLSVSGLLSTERAGASVTRTTPLGTPAAGELMILTFRVRQTAPVGSSMFTFDNIELSDSLGSPVETNGPQAIELNIEEAVSDLRLNLPAENIITEGEELQVSGSIFVNDITVTESSASSRITVWMGINTVDSDPSEWDEAAWSPMEFDGAENPFHRYVDFAGFGLSPGTYYIALRAQLDEGDIVFGGRSDAGGGIWDGVENVSSRLIVEQQPFFRHILAGWDFNDETLTAIQTVPANTGVVMQLVGAREDGFSSNGASGSAANSDGWQFTEGDDKYWLAELSTEGFRNITVDSKQYSTSAGPRDFELEASLDGTLWEVISTDTIKVASNWSSGVVDNAELPAVYNDRPKIYLRWIRRGDFRADGTEGITTGNNRVDDVFIKGENMNARDLTVWPGDTDDSGFVDELDVFPIGQFWLTEGPLPVFNSILWVPREVESWIPEEAASADANGDGIVSQRDLQPLGLHFGKSNSSEKHQADPSPTLSKIKLPLLRKEERITVAVKTTKPADLTGLSIRFRLDEIDVSHWKMGEIQPAEWASRWMEENRILTFSRRKKDADKTSAAWVLKGQGTPEKADSLAVVVIEAVENWNRRPEMVLEQVAITENRRVTRPENVLLTAEEGTPDGQVESDVPLQVRLEQNYPNPFNSGTAIRYALPDEEEVSIKMYDLLGREVATIFEGKREAGTYTIRYTPQNLSSGVYIYRLLTKDKVISRKLTYIK